MKLSKSLRYVVRIHEFETAHIEVGAEISNYDLNLDEGEVNRTTMGEILRSALDEEVDLLARTELEKVTKWSDFSPNTAEDYLGEPAHMQRSQHANKKIDPSPPGGRRIRRGGGGNTSPTSPPRKPAA